MSAQTLARNDTFLRRALWLDAAFETACGIGAILAANQLVAWTGLLSPAVWTLLGIGCLGYAALLVWMATRPEINRPLARAVMLANDAFAIVALVLLVAGWGSFNEGARWLIGLLALDAGIIAALQYEGLRRSDPAKASDVARQGAVVRG